MLLGAAAFIGPLMLYIATMRPDVDFWDTGEMQTVPWILGIAHPTGFPAFVLGGFAFAHLVPIGSVAWRMTLFSATAMAGAALALYAGAREIRLPASTALAGAWIFASSNLAWTRGTRTEVHALAIGLISLTLWIGLRFLRTHHLRLLPLGALSCSLAAAVHPVAVFFVPLMLAWAALGLLGDRNAAVRSLGRTRVAKLCALTALAACAGPLLYGYMPLRSAWVTATAADPTLALGIAPGRPYWDYGHTATPEGLLSEVSGSAFTVGGGLSGIVSPATYAKLPTVFFADLSTALGGRAVLPVLVLGAALLARRIGLPATAALLCCGMLAVPFAASYTSESDVPRYFLGAYWLATLLFVLGVETVARAALLLIELLLPRFTALPQAIRGVLPAFVVLPVVISNLLAGLPQMVAQHADTGARAFIDRVVTETPPDAVIVSFWTYATPLAYAAYVEHRMRRRIVETAWPADDAGFFHAWLQKRPIVIVTLDGSIPPEVTASRALDHGYPQLVLVTRAR